MLSSFEKRKVTIVGAGFSGLTSAFYLVRAGYEIEIFESSSRVGGLLSTLKTSHGLVETAANGLLNSPLVEDLFRELDVPLLAARREARHRFIFRDGQCRRWPLGFVSSCRVLWFGLRYIIARSSVAPRAGETVAAWSDRILGVEARTYLVDAALQGIYAGDTSRMSATLVLSRFFVRKTRSGDPGARVDSDSVYKSDIHSSAGVNDSPPPASTKHSQSARGSVAPPEGMGQLVSALETWLRAHGVAIHLNQKLNSRDELEKIATRGNHPILIATNPSSATKFVEEARAMSLRAIEMRPVTTTTAFFKSTDQKTKGFGVLFPPTEKRPFLGVLKNNFIFEDRTQNGLHSETWISAGASLTLNSNGNVASERSKIFDLPEQPLAATTTPWPEGIPHYTLELEAMIPQLEKPVGNVFLMGNYLGDLGLARILARASHWPQRLMQEGKWS